MLRNIYTTFLTHALEDGVKAIWDDNIKMGLGEIRRNGFNWLRITSGVDLRIPVSDRQKFWDLISNDIV